MTIFEFCIWIWSVGFGITAGFVFLTGGEHHIHEGEWKWIWFNLAIWPVWWLMFLVIAVLNLVKGKTK